MGIIIQIFFFFLIQSTYLYVLELTVGFEFNLITMQFVKNEKYLNLIKEMSRNYRCVKFVNLSMTSMSSLSVFSDECSTFLDMMNDIGFDQKKQLYKMKEMINIAIRATYYIFGCRNRNWDSPDLMQYWFYQFFYFIFLSFLWIIQSQAAFVNCLYVARFTIVHSKTQIKFPLLLLILLWLLLLLLLAKQDRAGSYMWVIMINN